MRKTKNAKQLKEIPAYRLQDVARLLWSELNGWTYHSNGYYYQLDYPNQWPAPRTKLPREMTEDFKAAFPDVDSIRKWLAGSQPPPIMTGMEEAAITVGNAYGAAFDLAVENGEKWDAYSAGRTAFLEGFTAYAAAGGMKHPDFLPVLLENQKAMLTVTAEDEADVFTYQTIRENVNEIYADLISIYEQQQAKVGAAPSSERAAHAIGKEGDYYQPMFDYFQEQHGLTLLQSEMGDIIHVVKPYIKDQWPDRDKD